MDRDQSRFRHSVIIMSLHCNDMIITQNNPAALVFGPVSILSSLDSNTRSCSERLSRESHRLSRGVLYGTLMQMDSALL